MSLRLWTWKWIGTLLVGASLMITACAPKLYIKESFRQSVTVPVVEGTIALDRGETIEVAAILKKEKVKPAKVLLTRLMGAYVLTAEGFRNIWFLQPTNRKGRSELPLCRHTRQKTADRSSIRAQRIPQLCNPRPQQWCQ